MKNYRRRHILFQLHTNGPPIGSKQVATAIRQAVLSIWGELTVGDSRLYLHSFDEATGFGILQVNARFVEQVIAAAALMNVIGNTEVSFDPKRISGTIKSLVRRFPEISPSLESS